MRFSKGHGTGNDFVVLPDLDGALQLTPAAVRLLCDRRRGIGADGVLRVVATVKVPEAAGLAADAPWFMDYHNADGSVAEMCGNGVRVYVRWLQQAGLVEPGTLGVATRDGIKTVQLPAAPAADITVDMGPPRIPGTARTVSVDGRNWDGTEVWMGNPHIVVPVGDVAEAGALLQPPLVVPPLETNVEFVARTGPDALAMRVHERGSGETLSCGTGACAAGVAVALWDGRQDGRWQVDVPGGRLCVTWNGDSVLLSGPAQLVAAGELSDELVAASGLVR
ncbi:MAG TPA: diaminopimelate epimerase [Mycobacteriales bacterium]|nr:diaminopimelate epimerase [Mycobacteriales bacterium]